MLDKWSIVVRHRKEALTQLRVPRSCEIWGKIDRTSVFFSVSWNAVEVNSLKCQGEKLRDALELHCPVDSD